MPQKTNLNVAPYYDDFDQSKNFYKLLFRPGYSIQTRELTSLQSVLQNQIESYGKYQFKQGDLVVPGEVGLNKRLDYVKLSSISEVAINEGGQIVYKQYDIKNLVGQQLQGVTSGVVASVVAAEYATTTDSDTLFVNYTNSGSSNTEATFRQGETLEVINGVNTPLLVVGTDGSVLPTSINITDPDTEEVSVLESPAMGYGSAVKVEEGIYFANGYFVRCDEELLVINKYYDKPSAKVGFEIAESIVTPEEDPSLFDNSRGFSNTSAPGSHRLKIALLLKEYPLNATTDNNFIQLLSIKNGEIQKKIVAADYSLLENTLARRTYDESGDYIVDNFSLEVREYYQQNNNLGLYQLNQSTNLVNSLTPEEASEKLIASIGPGKAYVRGFEIVNNETKYLPFNKAREVLTRDNITLKTSGTSQFKITNVFGTVPLNSEGAELTAYPTVYLNSLFNDGSIGLNNTESSTARKQTLNKRGTGAAPQDAFKTIYIQVRNTSPATIASLDDSTFQSVWGRLWFIKTRIGTAPATWDYVETISFSKVRRAEVDATTDLIEMTVKGSRDLLDTFLVEYDEAGSGAVRSLFLTESDAENFTNEMGIIVDYNETITSVVGLSKPKNVSISSRGSGFNQNTDKVISKGKTASGTASYNATFNFNYFNPVFFTRLTLDSVAPENNLSSTVFAPGQYIYGAKSGAYAVVEGASTYTYSFGNKLFVRMLSGNFLPGESISDEGGNKLRIANENTVSHFIVTNRGSNYTSPTVSLDGVEFDTNAILASTNGGNVYKVAVVDRDAVQTVYNKPPSVTLSSTTTPGDTVQVTPVMNRNVVFTYTAQNIKSLYSTFGSGNSYKFTADVQLDSNTDSETLPLTQGTFSGAVHTKYLVSNTFDGDVSKLLSQGDIVQFADDSGEVVRSIVQYATAPFGSNKSRIYLDRSLPTAATNVSVVRLRPVVSNTDTSSLVFPTGSKQVQSLIKDETDSKIRTHIRRDFVIDGSSSGGQLTFIAQLTFGTQRFVDYTEKNYIITVLDKGNSTTVEDGDVVYIDPSYVNIETSTDTTSGLTAGSVSIVLPNDYFGSISTGFPKLKLSATIEVTKARPRLKTAVRNRRITVISAGDRIIPLRGRDYDTEEVESYSYSDVFKLRYIYEGSTTEPPQVDTNGRLISGTDITNNFTFDDGQRDTFYDVSRIVLKPGKSAPTGQLVIAFDYFEHSQGDFCTVDSYIHEAGVGPGEVPKFNSSVHGNISLKDVIDYRPKVDNDVVVPGFQGATTLNTTDYAKFIGDGGVTSSTPAPDNNLSYTFSFSESQYMDRIDGVFLDKKGNFIIKEGNSSLNPSKPELVDDAIALYYIHIPSYTDSEKDVRVISVDNRRYTMRDIGKLEKRIERLEYYTTLSILEQQTLNMQIKDSVGFDRFKSGFIADNFEGHLYGNLGSDDYQAAIDSQQSVLRPTTKEDSFDLVELNTRTDERIANHYTNTNGVVTLPYTNTKLLGNSFATKTINPNPFVLLQYVGDAQLSPSVDQWYDTTQVPLVRDSNTSLYNIYTAKTDAKEAISSYYNSFIVNWIGSNRSFFNIAPLSETATAAAQSKVVAALTNSSSNISPLNNETAKGAAVSTVNGNTIVSSVQYFVRSIPVKYNLTRLKASTKFYVFMEGRDIGRWVNPDIKYSGIAGNSPSSFGKTITTDENGNASGIILIPAGYAPQSGTSWTGDVNTMLYDENSEEIRFTVGIKTIRFTTSADNASKDSVDSYAEVKYYATGALPENPSSIISTLPAQFKANEGRQVVDNTTQNVEKPNPLAQTFEVENFDGGVFATGVDLFFSKKDTNTPVRVYITNTDVGKPGKFIVPGSVSVKNSNTYLKVTANADLTISIGENITGKSSGAVGPLLKLLDKNDTEIVASSSSTVDLSPDQVYTLVLSNHNGISFLPNEELIIASLTSFNATNGTANAITIAKNSGRVSDLKVTNLGGGYDSAVITIESPQLPGSSTATGTAYVSGGKIYNAEIQIDGNGYTEPPSVTIRGTGTAAAGASIQSFIEITSYAVRMGVATDVAGVTQSTVPTFFEFEHPVYLQNDAEYTLVIETDSSDYAVWASRLSESDVTTGASVTTQPLLGSVYKSQNTAKWEEDVSEDIKFTLYRAKFDNSRSGTFVAVNENLGYEALTEDPIETYALANTNATSTLFKNNNSIIRVSHRDHGFEQKGASFVFYKSLENVGGFTGANLNAGLYTVSNSGVDSYTIVGPNRASSNSVGGGSGALASYNRKYEKLFAQVGYIQSPNTSISTSVKTTNIVPVDSNTTNYVSYSQEEYEKTFLNEEHFFLNQKVIASRINEISNNINNSLEYKFALSSDVDYLSPLIDLRVSSVKTATNRIENSTGTEGRYAKRNQVLKFNPLFTVTVSGNSQDIDANQSVEGVASGTTGTVLAYDSATSRAVIQITSESNLIQNEELKFALQSAAGGNLSGDTVTVVGLTPKSVSFEIGSTIVAFNPNDVTQKYDNKISGKIVEWDPIAKELTVENDKNPINNDYTSRITLGSAFTREADVADQTADIFRVGDIIFYTNIPSGEEKYIRVSSMEFTPGVDFVSDLGAKDTSAVAKYVTKQVSINSPGTSIDVRTTVNLKDVENVRLLYKIKEAGSDVDFENIEWSYFNGTGAPDVDVLATETNSASGLFEKQEDYQELVYSVSELPEFTSFAIKVVMKSDDPVYVPKLQDLRAVASY